MRSRVPGNALALAAAVAMAGLTIYVSYTRLRIPQASLDWAALVLSGATAGILTFFVVWGHFQGDADEQE